MLQYSFGLFLVRHFLVICHGLSEGCDDFVGQVEVDSDASKECECPGRLGNHQEVDHSVHDPGTHEDPEDKGCGGKFRVSEDVEEAEYEEG